MPIINYNAPNSVAVTWQGFQYHLQSVLQLKFSSIVVEIQIVLALGFAKIFGDK